MMICILKENKNLLINVIIFLQNNPKLNAGCLILAIFLGAAGNTINKYYEIEYPPVL